MTRVQFISQLRRALAGTPQQEIDDIVADYNAHFDEALSSGRSEQDVATALGDPGRLARELRAEAGLRRWETQRTPAALIGAVAGLGGMLALDVFIVLPFLCAILAIVFVLALVLFGVGVAGLGLLLSGLVHWSPFSIFSVSSRLLAGVGLLGGSLGFGAVLWLMLEALVRVLGSYVRLHYHVIKPSESSAV